MIDDLGVLGEKHLKRVGVPPRDGGVEVCDVSRRGVRSHAAANGMHRRRLGRERLEARERFGVAVGVEVLHAREQAIGSEDRELDEPPLVGTAARAGRAEVRPVLEERVGS